MGQKKATMVCKTRQKYEVKAQLYKCDGTYKVVQVSIADGFFASSIDSFMNTQKQLNNSSLNELLFFASFPFMSSPG